MNHDTDALDLVWGAKKIAKIIGTSTRQTFKLLEANKIPATKIGNQWVADRKVLKNHILKAREIENE